MVGSNNNGSPNWRGIDELLEYLLKQTDTAREAWYRGADAPFSFEELKDLLGSENTNGSYFKPGSGRNVRDTVIERDVYNPIPDKSALWNRACELFTVDSTSRAWGKQLILLNDEGATLSAFLLSSTWRNPINAQYKRRAAYLNLMKRFGKEDLYCLKVAPDDWTPQRRDALSRAARRREGKYLYIDNQLSLGVQWFITNVPLKGAKPVTDHEAMVVTALKGIRPPERGADDNRFRPIGGCAEWFNGLYDCGEDDQKKWQVVAVDQRKNTVLDLQVMAAAEGLRTEWVRPYWRMQAEPGFLIHTESWPAHHVVQMLHSCGYTPTRLGYQILAEASVFTT